MPTGATVSGRIQCPFAAVRRVAVAVAPLLAGASAQCTNPEGAACGSMRQAADAPARTASAQGVELDFATVAELSIAVTKTGLTVDDCAHSRFAPTGGVDGLTNITASSAARIQAELSFARAVRIAVGKARVA